MRNIISKEKLFPTVCFVGALALSGCTNSDFDLSKVDMTMGFGGDELVLPNSSTDVIKLADVLDLESDGSVSLDADSNYVFRLGDTSVSPARPYVDKIRLDPQAYAWDYEFNPTASSIASRAVTRAAGVEFNVPEQTVAKFGFNGNSSEVKSLSSASVETTTMVLTLEFDGAIPTCMPTISEMNLKIPGYLRLVSAQLVGGNGEASMVQGGVKLTNVSTSAPIKLELKADKLDFTSYDTAYGQLNIADNGDIAIDGLIGMSMRGVLAGVPSSASFKIHSTMSIGSLVVSEATGKFDPTINITSLGGTTVTGVPEFLRDGNVCVDVYNPQIKLKVGNDMDVAATVGGTAIAYKDGREIARVPLSDMAIHRKSDTVDDTTRICICRVEPAVKEAGWDYYPVSTLSSLIQTIPDRIEIVDPNARADQDTEATFKFGHTYCVAPRYSVEAPLAFAEKAVIVYKDSTDGWHDDIKDLELSDGSYVELTADVESRVPVYLDIKADPVDTRGKTIAASKLKVEIPNGINASADGQQSVSTSVSVKISQLESDALKQLDGLRFTITGAASKENEPSVTGVTLNARSHTLRLSNIKVKVKGKVIGDFN